MTEYPPGTIMVRGRELVMLNFNGQWLAPGVFRPMPAPDESWTTLRVGWDGASIERARRVLNLSEPVGEYTGVAAEQYLRQQEGRPWSESDG